MTTRRTFLRCLGAAALAGVLPQSYASALPAITVYSSPACDCCARWVAHLRESGFRVQSNLVDDVTPVKRRLGVPEALYSCHTASVAGYAIEGHVPAGDIKRLLRERKPVRGLAVPGMVIGSPGMEQGVPQAYATLAFDERGSSVFARH